MGTKNSKAKKAAKEAAKQKGKETKVQKGKNKSEEKKKKDSLEGRPLDKCTKEDFEWLKVVGRGSFGKVIQVRKRDTGVIYALKILKKEQLVAKKQVTHTKTERKILQDINHPFLVSLRYAFQDEHKLYMILDFFNGGELFFHLKNDGRFNEKRTRFYAAEILCALECLHNKNIVYRDLKPENLLLDNEGHIKLTDFGLAKESVTGDEMVHTFCGTPEYLAPEIVHSKGYGKPVDWWSFGTLVYEMLTGLPPFYDNNMHEMYRKIVSEEPEMPAFLSKKAIDLISKLLEKDPKKRLGTQSIQDIKNHAFFKKIDWDKLVKREVQPTYVPDVLGDDDLTFIDEEFKHEVLQDTPVAVSTKKKGEINFTAFTLDQDEEEEESDNAGALED